MHIHIHFRHSYLFLIPYVISNEKTFPVKKKKNEGKIYCLQINIRKRPCNSYPPPPIKERKKIHKYWIDKIIFSLLWERQVNAHKELRAPSVEGCSINTKHRYNLLLNRVNFFFWIIFQTCHSSGLSDGSSDMKPKHLFQTRRDHQSV